MPGADWWDEAIDREFEEIDALRWLVTQLRGHSLHIDGKQWWSLPLSVLSPYPAQTPLEAILASYRKYKAHMELRHGGDHTTRLETIPGAISERGEVRQEAGDGAVDGGVPGEQASTEVHSS